MICCSTDGADGLTALYLAKADMAGTDQNVLHLYR